MRLEKMKLKRKRRVLKNKVKIIRVKKMKR